MTPSDITALTDVIQLVSTLGMVDGIFYTLGTWTLINLIWAAFVRVHRHFKPSVSDFEECPVVFDDYLGGDIQRFLEMRAEYYGYTRGHKIPNPCDPDPEVR